MGGLGTPLCGNFPRRQVGFHNFWQHLFTRTSNSIDLQEEMAAPGRKKNKAVEESQYQNIYNAFPYLRATATHAPLSALNIVSGIVGS